MIPNCNALFRNNAMHFQPLKILKERLWPCPQITEAGGELNLARSTTKLRPK